MTGTGPPPPEGSLPQQGLSTEGVGGATPPAALPSQGSGEVRPSATQVRAGTGSVTSPHVPGPAQAPVDATEGSDLQLLCYLVLKQGFT